MRKNGMVATALTRPRSPGSLAIVMPACVILLAFSAPAYSDGGMAAQPKTTSKQHPAQWEIAVQKIRNVCRVDKFLACMRWDTQICESMVNESVNSGVAAARPQVHRLSQRLRETPGLVDGLYVGSVMGALLKTSGPRLNNCLPNPDVL
jgi:hypothetical protein